jgi:hypothetical protein
MSHLKIPLILPDLQVGVSGPQMKENHFNGFTSSAIEILLPVAALKCQIKCG